MSIKRILFIGLSATALSTAAWASDTYQCGESRCYDDQADETRRLNLMQLEDAGAVNDAAPGYGNANGSYDDNAPYNDGDDDSDMNGQGGPYDPYDPNDDDGDYGPPPPDAGPPPVDGSYGPEDAEPPYGPPDTGAYPDDDNDEGYSPDDDDDATYPDDDE